MNVISPRRFARFARSPAAFREYLCVDVDGEVVRLGDVMDDWQRDDYIALDAALKRCCGRSSKPARMRAYLERPRGHSKTTDLAVMVCYALTFAKRPIKGFAFAVDKEQAKLLKDAAATIIRLNPWIGRILTVERNRVVNKADSHPGHGSEMTINTSDVGSSYGILPDLIIADELTHWQGEGSLWHSLISSAAKRESCLLVCISNAGFAESWQWQVRETARTDDDWYFSCLDGPKASWITPKRLDEQRRMLPAVAYARLWLNQWSSSGGDALTTEDIEAAFDDSLAPMTGTEKGFRFVAGVDLSVTRDGTAVVVLAVPEGGKAGRIRLAHHKLWRPTLGRKINLVEVERYLLRLADKYKLGCIAFDPWQAESMAQRIEVAARKQRRYQNRKTAFMREIPPTGSGLREQATLTIESFNDRRLQLYDCEPLRRDLHKLRVEEKSYGCRLVSPRDGDGHGDSFSAFVLALLLAHEIAGKAQITIGSMESGIIEDDEDDELSEHGLQLWRLQLARAMTRHALSHR